MELTDELQQQQHGGVYEVACCETAWTSLAVKHSTAKSSPIQHRAMSAASNDVILTF